MANIIVNRNQIVQITHQKKTTTPLHSQVTNLLKKELRYFRYEFPSIRTLTLGNHCPQTNTTIKALKLLGLISFYKNSKDEVDIITISGS